MTEMLYVITAEILQREQDGTDPQDGSPLQKAFTYRETWMFPASISLGEAMKEVNSYNSGSGYVVSVSINEDRVSAAKVHEERMAVYRSRQKADADIPD
jgi:hypothetical protein